LNDVQRKVFIPDGKNRLFERPALDICKEIREFLVGGQLECLFFW